MWFLIIVKVIDKESLYFEKTGKIKSYIKDSFRENYKVKIEEYDFDIWFDVEQLEIFEDNKLIQEETEETEETEENNL